MFAAIEAFQLLAYIKEQRSCQNLVILKINRVFTFYSDRWVTMPVLELMARNKVLQKYKSS